MCEGGYRGRRALLAFGDRAREWRVSMTQDRKTWLVWGVFSVSIFDGYRLNEPSTMDEAERYIALILERDPEWPLPNYDVEDLADLNSSWMLIVSGITEDEVRAETEEFLGEEVRGYLPLD